MPTAFPRQRNGFTDNGGQLKSAVGEKCPNCGSPQYRQTISTEDCPSCGLHCDYWGGGANAVYTSMMDANEQRRQERLQRLGWEMERRFREGESELTTQEMNRILYT